jgi:D-lactate dehydrogenase
MPSPILFLEVDPQDRPMVTGQFPDAEVRSEAFSGDELIKACTGKEAVCCFIYSKFSAEVINALPDLKLLCTRSVGYNHIDIAACRTRGILVCNVPDYGSHVIAEHVFALLLSALRHVTEADSKVASGNFDYRGLRGMALMGKTIGIVGTGKIGFCVAKIAHGFGMRILAVDKCRIVDLETVYGVKYVDLDTLYKESDILTLHVPALPDTIHMIDAKAIEKMRNGVIIVNTARGELIDSTALLQALDSDKVARALLDVLEHEQDFQLNEKLIKHKSVIVTPHIAFYADDSTTRMFLESLYSIHQWQWKEKITHEVKPPTVVCDLPGVRGNTAKK